MATIGQILENPESGFKRLENTDANILYQGTGWVLDTHYAYSGGSRQSCANTSILPSIKFNFTGSSITLISSLHSTYTDKIELIIDSKSRGFLSQVGTGNMSVFYAVTGLTNKEHSVELIKINKGAFSTDFTFDAIDIKNDGVLKPYKEVLLHDKILLLSGSGKVRSVTLPEISKTTSVPKMTSNIEPKGVAFASSTQSTYHPYYAFNQSDDLYGWVVLGSSTTGHIGYEFDISKKIVKYSVRSSSASYLSRNPKNWTFEGSNDGVNYTTLDTQLNQTWTTEYTDKDYIVKNTQKYKFYRLNITSINGGTSIYLNELKFFEEFSSPAIRETPSQSEQSFINYGMSQSDLSSIDTTADFTAKHYIQDASNVLGEGKVFEQVLDMNKVLKSIKIK